MNNYTLVRRDNHIKKHLKQIKIYSQILSKQRKENKEIFKSTKYNKNILITT